ncbi:MAG: hypothetical protein IJ661_13280 [Lachnospiraceae bacterium]|nr:hypothetical protein [Lachnospiraceae bacterium]
MDWFKFFFFLIGLWVLAYMLTFDPAGNDYLENGIKVEATISQKTPKIRNGYDYNCYYINDKGEKVTAYLILNQTNGELGQVVEGYYLPDEPKTVWCEPGKGFMLVFTLIVDVLAVGMTILFIFAIVINKNKDSNKIPSYAVDGTEDYDATSTSDVRSSPWGFSQNPTWDEKQDAKDARDEWSRQQAQQEEKTGSGNDNNKSSGGLKLKM